MSGLRVLFFKYSEIKMELQKYIDQPFYKT